MKSQNVLSTWEALAPRKKLIVVAATVTVFVLMALLARGRTPEMQLLYSGLEPSAAGQVVTALDARGVSYDVRGGSIFVDPRSRDQLRMSLAAEGLPAMGGKGYELLDELSGFGTTSQMFDAAYWRAKEGELARTIMSSPHIRAARVHISGASSRPFQRGASGSAAVTVTTQSAPLSRDQAMALKHLVAASVAELAPGDVAIIDDKYGLISVGDDPSRFGNDLLAEELKARVERLLVAHVGAGNAVVEVAVERVSEREVLTERRVDPESRVAISSDSEKRSDSRDGGAGAVTVASNLPDGDATAAGGSEQKSSETRERKNYEVSEIRREVERSPGDIKRLSVAVLLNQVMQTDADGVATTEARSSEELDRLRELVASAVGLTVARGDVITVESMPFEALPHDGALVEAQGRSLQDFDALKWAQLASFSIVALVLGLFVLRPILLPKNVAGTSPVALDLSAPIESAEPLELPLDELPASQELAPLPAPLDFGGFEPLASLNDDSSPARLRSLFGERREEAFQVLRGWLDEPGEAEEGIA